MNAVNICGMGLKTEGLTDVRRSTRLLLFRWVFYLVIDETVDHHNSPSSNKQECRLSLVVGCYRL